MGDTGCQEHWAERWKLALMGCNPRASEQRASFETVLGLGVCGEAQGSYLERRAWGWVVGRAWSVTEGFFAGYFIYKCCFFALLSHGLGV